MHKKESSIWIDIACKINTTYGDMDSFDAKRKIIIFPRQS
jgi:hypothetical protein